MVQDTKSDLSKRLEGKSLADQIREIIFELEDLRKDMEKTAEKISEEIISKKDKQGL